MTRLNTQTVSKLITQVSERHMQSSDKAHYSPEYLNAMDAVLTLLERRVDSATDVGKAVALARQAWSSLNPSAAGDNRNTPAS